MRHGLKFFRSWFSSPWLHLWKRERKRKKKVANKKTTDPVALRKMNTVIYVSMQVVGTVLLLASMCVVIGIIVATVIADDMTLHVVLVMMCGVAAFEVMYTSGCFAVAKYWHDSHFIEFVMGAIYTGVMTVLQIIMLTAVAYACVRSLRRCIKRRVGGEVEHV